MDLNKVQEEFSKAWLYILASSAGCSVTFPPRDINSVDATIASDISGKTFSCGVNIEVQLKCTRKNIFEQKGDSFSFNLPIKNYNELRAHSGYPRILVLLAVPEETKDWAITSAEETIIKKSAYWVSIAGMEERENNTSVSIEIPKKNILTPESLGSILREVAESGVIQ